MTDRGTERVDARTCVRERKRLKFYPKRKSEKGCEINRKNPKYDRDYFTSVICVLIKKKSERDVGWYEVPFLCVSL